MAEDCECSEEVDSARLWAGAGLLLAKGEVNII
jgi:hypothetical protein